VKEWPGRGVFPVAMTKASRPGRTAAVLQAESQPDRPHDPGGIVLQAPARQEGKLPVTQILKTTVGIQQGRSAKATTGLAVNSCLALGEAPPANAATRHRAMALMLKSRRDRSSARETMRALCFSTGWP
jgi:hypothetical protein